MRPFVRFHPNWFVLLVGILLLGLVSACAPGAVEAPDDVQEAVSGESANRPADEPREVEKEVVQEVGDAEPGEEVSEPESTQPLPTPAPTPTTQLPTPIVEARIVELEWPPELRLGDSDVLRLALIPSQDGYTVQTEFPDHQVDTQPIQVQRPGGYDLFAVARLDGVGFEIAPAGEQVQFLPPGEMASWSWSLRARAVGRQRLSVVMLLRWEPVGPGALRESVVFSRGLDIRIRSFFGLSRGQAMAGGLVGLLLGGGLCLVGFALPAVPVIQPAQTGAPNARLSIETGPEMQLSDQEETLLRVLFRRYARLVLGGEFLSGYSGARTLLARPIHTDGRADADTIVKIGLVNDVQREFANYERFVKDTLPPITARIQHPPVKTQRGDLGALRYTFIGAPGHTPTSLRAALLETPDPQPLQQLFDTFGPNWWMQRKPYIFRLAVEYDRVLPVHLVLEPASGRGQPIDGHTHPEMLDVRVGDLVTLGSFPSVEPRHDGSSLSLHGAPSPGGAELRVRWLSLANPNGATGRIMATRHSQLRDFSLGMDLFGLPDPIPRLPDLLAETVCGGQSTIHGDLNLENILIGPGGFIWLIDFAETRDGHTLFDFGHLGAELVAHVIAPGMANPHDYFDLLLSDPFQAGPEPSDPSAALLAALSAIGAKCLFNPSEPGEFNSALCLSCLGALKYRNLDFHQKHLLYLTAAYLCSREQ